MQAGATTPVPDPVDADRTDSGSDPSDTASGSGEQLDFFISHAGRDLPWAEWVAWQLTDAGLRVELDAWHWQVGANFMARMHDVIERADRVIALLSSAYFEGPRFTNAEWTAAMLSERQHGQPRLLPVRIEEVSLPALFRPLIYVDLFGLGEEAARTALTRAVGGPRQPDASPAYPGTGADRPARIGTTAPAPGAGPRITSAVPAATGASAGEANVPAQRRVRPPRLPGTMPPAWNAPPRTPTFTGRDDLLAAVREALRGNERRVVQALHGIGGVGKTQLATEFAHRFAADYDLVWWVNADQPALIGEQLAAAAEALGLVGPGTDTPSATMALRSHLGRQPDWLLVFDNAESADDVLPWLPDGPGDVLVTSRSHVWTGVAEPVDVTVFARGESVTLLTRNVRTLSAADAARLAEAVGDLPLALTQAASLLAETGMPVPEYLAELERSASDVMTEGRPAGYPTSLAAAVRISVDRLSTVDESAVQMLRLCAELAPEPVPPQLFADAPDGVLPQPLAGQAGNRLALRRSMGRLASFGLARVAEEGPQVHRLVQAILRDSLDPSLRAAVRTCAERLLVAALPEQAGDPTVWPVWARLVPHLLAVDATTTADADVRSLACATIFHLVVRGDAATAQPLAQRLFDSWTVHFGHDHADRLRVASHLGAILRALGRYEQARTLDEETLARRVATLGDAHPDTWTSRHDLAADLRALGHYAQARELDASTLDWRRENLGWDHPQSIFSAVSLAADLRRLRRFAEALALDEDTWERDRRVLPEDHPQTLAAANSVAADLRGLDQVERAYAIDEETLQRRRRVLGEDHPETMFSAVSVAQDLRRLGDLERARDLDEQTWHRRRRLLGENHPHTLYSAACLATDLRTLGDAERARQIDEDTLQRRRAVLGEDHPNTIFSMVGLANDLRRLGEHEGAAALDQEVRRLRGAGRRRGHRAEQPPVD